jgi:autotransporter-associated beta strand protein
MWLAPVATGNAAAGNYTNRTTFLLDTVDPATAVLSGKWAMDNQGLDLLLNGVSTGLSNLVAGAQGSFQSFTLTNGFVPGLNTMDIAILNFVSGGANPTGWRFEMRGVALPLSNTPPVLTTQPVNVVTQAQQTASFSVAAAGSGPLAYQWFHGATLLNGQTSRALTLSAVTTADNGTYSVTITNGAGSTNASATLTVVTPPALVWLGIDATRPTFWDTVTTNWLDTGSSANVPFAQLDDVRFDSSGSAQPVVDLILPLTPNSVRVDAATDYTFMSSASSGALGGSAVLIKTNVGTLILDTVNSNTGPTTISGGTLQVGNADANGTLGSGPVNNNASLVFNRVDTFTVANSISGTGSVTVAGSGTVAVTGNNTYSGPTVISSGILNARNSTALGSIGAGTTVAAGGQLYIFGDVTLAAEPLTLSGATALRKANGVSTIFGGPITLATDGGIEVDTAATLSLTNAAGIVGTNVGLSLQGDAAGSRGTVSGSVSLGTGALTENGLGTWVLLATNNDWSGGTVLNGGVLQIGDGGANGSIGTNSITLNGGTTLTFNSAANLVLNAPIQNSGTLLSFVGSGNFTIGGTIQNNSPMTFGSSGNLLVSGDISGGGVVNQNGTGILTLTGNNGSYSGATTLRGTGVLRPMNNLALGTGTCTIGSAQTDSCRLELLGGLSLSNAFTIFPRAFGTLTNPANFLNVSGTNIVSPPSSIVIPTGGNLLTLASDSGRLIYAGGITAGGAGRDLVFKGAGAGEVLGNIDHSGANSVLIWKLDAGAWTLWGSNTPNAATTISNGLLVINGTMDASLITVAGGTLGGTGVLSGPLVVNAGATLAPGSSIGTLTVSDNLTLQAGSITSVELNKSAATCDQVLGMSNVVYGGTLVISNLSGTLATGDAFKLFDAMTYSGSFAALSPTNPPGAGIRWNTNTLATDGTLRVLSTVPSQPVINSVVNAGGSIVFGGTNGSAWGSYSVLSTNSLTIPRTNWPIVATGVFDGAGQFSYTNTITPGTPQRFFLLRAQ